MKIQKIIALLILSVFISCTKTAEELLELSENNLQNSKVDLAISDLEKLLKKHPNDSLASKAQYKLSSIYLNWKNDPDMGFKQLEATLKNYDNSVHGKQALDQINEFPQYLINKAESLRKQKLLKESVENSIVKSSTELNKTFVSTLTEKTSDSTEGLLIPKKLTSLLK